MTLKIISSTETVYEGQVSMVSLPGEKGTFTVLQGHASLISTLRKGSIVYRTDDGADHSVDVAGGLVDVDDNIISVCIF